MFLIIKLYVYLFNKVSSAVYSPDGKFIVSASYDETIRIWDAQSH